MCIRLYFSNNGIKIPGCIKATKKWETISLTDWNAKNQMENFLDNKLKTRTHILSLCPVERWVVLTVKFQMMKLSIFVIVGYVLPIQDSC